MPCRPSTGQPMASASANRFASRLLLALCGPSTVVLEAADRLAHRVMRLSAVAGRPTEAYATRQPLGTLGSTCSRSGQRTGARRTGGGWWLHLEPRPPMRDALRPPPSRSTACRADYRLRPCPTHQLIVVARGRQLRVRRAALAGARATRPPMVGRGPRGGPRHRSRFASSATDCSPPRPAARPKSPASEANRCRRRSASPGRWSSRPGGSPRSRRGRRP